MYTGLAALVLVILSSLDQVQRDIWCKSIIEWVVLESCTDFLLCLFDLFGPRPSSDILRGVVIDRACDVHKYCKSSNCELNFDYNDGFQRIGEEGDEACAYYSTELNWMLDPFHAKGHTEPACTLDHADCEYHPRLEKHRELCENYNLEVLMKIFRFVNEVL